MYINLEQLKARGYDVNVNERDGEITGLNIHRVEGQPFDKLMKFLQHEFELQRSQAATLGEEIVSLQTWNVICDCDDR